MKIAILDDYQDAVRKLPCFKLLNGLDVTIFQHGAKGQGQLAIRLADFDVLVLIRERTTLNRALISRLPKLKLICQTGRIGSHVDLKAAAERGVRLIAPTNKRRASNAEGEKKSMKRRREDNDKELGIEESLKSQGTANRRIIVEHWNSVVERWALARRVHHDQTHMVTYIQWFIHLLAVLTEPPHPVTRGG